MVRGEVKKGGTYKAIQWEKGVSYGNFEELKEG